ncbi:MAG: nitroreductase family protein, partial [Nanoarchaeota archaeon]
EVAQWSPSCHNLQPWTFIVVRNKRTIRALVDSSISAGFVPHLPPVVIAIMLDEHCIEGVNRCAAIAADAVPEAHICIGTASLNICYAAQAKGWQTGLLSPDPGIAAKLLRVPRGCKVPLLVLFGKERKGAYRKPRQRKSLRDIVRSERA